MRAQSTAEGFFGHSPRPIKPCLTMCGIVGAVAERNIVPVLVEGLKRLEYRGYDSAGVAVLQPNHKLGLRRTVGKVAQLEEKLAAAPLSGRLGVAHTRWATHGGVTEANAHPHLS